MLRIIETVSTRLSMAGAWVAAALLVYMVCHVLVEIFFRTVLHSSTFSMDEYVGYSIAFMTFLSIAHVFREGRLIRVNILTNAVSGLASLLVELACIALTFSVISFFSRYVWRSLYRNWERGTISPTLTETPVWIVESVIFCGLCILMLQMLATAILRTARFIGGEEE